jgi:type 1 glutamine amidotransferase
MGESLHIHVNQSDHPITRNMVDWEMIDETYKMPEPQADAPSPNDILLTTDHEKSMKPIAWTRSYPAEAQAPETRIFCLQSGHDHDTWSHENFRKVLRRGILWCAGRI